MGAVTVVGWAVVEGQSGCDGQDLLVGGWSCCRQALVTCPRASRHTTILVCTPSSPQGVEHCGRPKHKVTSSCFDILNDINITRLRECDAEKKKSANWWPYLFWCVGVVSERFVEKKKISRINWSTILLVITEPVGLKVDGV